MREIMLNNFKYSNKTFSCTVKDISLITNGKIKIINNETKKAVLFNIVERKENYLLFYNIDLQLKLFFYNEYIYK